MPLLVIGHRRSFESLSLGKVHCLGFPLCGKRPRPHFKGITQVPGPGHLAQHHMEGRALRRIRRKRWCTAGPTSTPLL